MPRHPKTGDPAALLVEGMVMGGSEAIEASEARGQREMVDSEVVPTEGAEQLVDLGFELGDVVEGDPLFRAAKLPEGWTREGSGHSMHSFICDERGFRRVAIFYKAAIYDRRADCHVETRLVTGAQGKAIDAAFDAYGFPDCDVSVAVEDEVVTLTRRTLKRGADGRPIREAGEWVGTGEVVVVKIATDGSES